MNESTLSGYGTLLLAEVQFLIDEKIYEELLSAITLAIDTKV